MNRRVFLFGSVASVASATASVEFGRELKSGDVRLMVDRLEGDAGLMVAVRAESQDADHALVEVFYRVVREVEGRRTTLLLHQESIAPIVPGAMGATNRDFDIPKRDVQFIRVTLLQTVGEVQEFR